MLVAKTELHNSNIPCIDRDDNEMRVLIRILNYNH